MCFPASGLKNKVLWAVGHRPAAWLPGASRSSSKVAAAYCGRARVATSFGPAVGPGFPCGLSRRYQEGGVETAGNCGGRPLDHLTSEGQGRRCEWRRGRVAATGVGGQGCPALPPMRCTGWGAGWGRGPQRRGEAGHVLWGRRGPGAHSPSVGFPSGGRGTREMRFQDLGGVSLGSGSLKPPISSECGHLLRKLPGRDPGSPAAEPCARS